MYAQCEWDRMYTWETHTRSFTHFNREPGTVLLLRMILFMLWLLLAAWDGWLLLLSLLLRFSYHIYNTSPHLSGLFMLRCWCCYAHVVRKHTHYKYRYTRVVDLRAIRVLCMLSICVFSFALSHSHRPCRKFSLMWLLFARHKKNHSNTQNWASSWWCVYDSDVQSKRIAYDAEIDTSY